MLVMKRIYEAKGQCRIESIPRSGSINHAGDERRMMKREEIGGRNLYFFKLPGRNHLLPGLVRTGSSPASAEFPSVIGHVIPLSGELQGVYVGCLTSQASFT